MMGMNGDASAAIAERRAVALGEVRLTFAANRAVLSGPECGDGEMPALDPTPEAIRQHVRFDDSGRYRPLSGARTLPSNWRVTVPTSDVEAALETIYPHALRHQRQEALGQLRVVPLEAVIARQRGRYRSAAELGPDGRRLARGALCSRCVRTPVWAADVADPGAVPCPEPCSLMLALCREAAEWQNDPPSPSTPDPDIAYADFSAPGNEIREAYLAAPPPGISHG